MKSSRLLLVVFAVLAMTSSIALAADAESSRGNWPRWRGPNQDGHSSETGFPTQWNDDSIQWKTPLKGEGQSSPVVWGERIFLTLARDKGKQRLVLCLNRNDGRILWEKVAWIGEPEPSHRMNGWASATPVTDGKHVYAFFGRGGGLFCYTVNGERVWSKNLGRFECPWGTAASPVLVGDLVIQNCDSDENAYIIALNKNTGKEVWRTERDDHRGWSTPILIETGNRKELVLNGHTGVRAYNPHTGKELWYCKSFNGRGSPTVTPSDAGLLHVINGLRGDTYAIKPGGNGDVTKTHRVWHSPRVGGRDLPSPIAISKYVVMVSMRGGIMNCYEAATGKELWRTRLGGQFSASPIAYDGVAVFIREDGETFVVKPGPEPNVVARNRLSHGSRELFRSSITPSDGQLFIRSTGDRFAPVGTLYCVGKRHSATK